MLACAASMDKDAYQNSKVSLRNKTDEFPEKSRTQYVSFPVKSDSYVNAAQDSNSRTGKEKRSDTVCGSSSTPLISPEKGTASTNGSFKVSGMDNNMGGPQVETNNNGIPPIPHKKPSTRVFRKMEKVEMNPMPNPGDKRLPSQSSEDETERKIAAMQEFATDGYLTPSDPPPYHEADFRFSNTDVPTSPTASESNTSSWKKKGKQFQRFDSGVGDCESDRGSGSVRFSASPSMSSAGSFMSNPRLSTQYEQQYEDIDQYQRSHQQERQQQQRGSTDKFAPSSTSPPVRNGLRPLPPVIISGVTNSDSEDYDNSLNISMAETVSHPAQATHNGTLPHTYMPLNNSNPVVSEKPPTKIQARSCSCGLILALIVIFLISVAALSLSIYVLISRPDDNDQTPALQSAVSQVTPEIDLDGALAPLKEEIALLKEENARLRDVLMTQQKNFTAHVEPLKDEVEQLSSQQSNLSYFVQSMEVKLESEIANISLTPGQKGPAGVADFSLCVNHSVSSSAPAHATLTTDTTFQPSETDIQKYFVTFAYCTFRGATVSSLETTPDSTFSRYRYRCKCWGQVDNFTHTSCTIHLWMCPYTQ